MKAPTTKPEVELADKANAFMIINRASRALLQSGADKEYINKYREKATAGDYDNLLRITMKYVDVC